MNDDQIIKYARQLRSQGKTEDEIANTIQTLIFNTIVEGSNPTVKGPAASVVEPEQPEPVVGEVTTIEKPEESSVNPEPHTYESLLEDSRTETNQKLRPMEHSAKMQKGDGYSLDRLKNDWQQGTLDREINNTILEAMNYEEPSTINDKTGSSVGLDSANPITFDAEPFESMKGKSMHPADAYKKIQKIQSKLASIPKGYVKKVFEGVMSDNSLSEWDKTKKLVSLGTSNPSILASLSVSSIASAPEALLLSTLGSIVGPGGMVIASMMGTYNAESMNVLASLLEQHNIDISKKESFLKLADNPDLQDKIMSESNRRGLAVAATEGLFTALSLGLNKLTPSHLVGKLGKTASTATLETLGEGLGEGAGLEAQGADASLSEMAVEALAGAGKSSIETGLVMSMDTGQAALGGDKTSVDPNSIEGMMASATEEVEQANESSTKTADRLTEEATADTADAVDVEKGTIVTETMNEHVAELIGDDAEVEITPEVVTEETKAETKETKAETKETKKKPKKDTKKDTKKEKKEGMAVYAAGRDIEEGLGFEVANNSKVSRDLDKARKAGNKEAIAGMEAWQAEYQAEQKAKKAAKDKKVAKEQEVTKATREVEVAKKKKETAKKKTQKEALKDKEKARKKAEPKPKEKAKPVEKAKPTPKAEATPEVEVTPMPKETGDNTSEFNKKQIAYREEKKAKLDAKKEEDSAVVDQELTDEQKDAKAKIVADKVRNKKRTGQTPKTPKEEATRKREPLEKRYKEAYKKVKSLEEAVRNASHPDNKEKRSQTLALAQQKLAEADDNLRDLRNKQNSEGTITTSKNHPNFDSQTTAQIEKLGRVATNEAAVAKQKELDTSFSNGGAVDFENDMRASRSEDQSKARGKKHIQGDSKQVTLAGKDGEVHTTLDGNVKVVPSIQDYFKTRLDEIITALDSPKLSKTQKVFFTATLSFLRNFINSDFLTTITELQKKQGNLTMRVVEADKITSKNDKGLFVEAAGLFSPANNLLFVSRETGDKGPLSSIETTIHELMHAIQMIVKDAINNSDIKLEATESFFNYTRAVNGEYRHKDFRNTAKILDIIDQIVKTGKVGKDTAKQLKDLGASDALISLIVDNNHTDLFGGVYNKLAYALSDVDGGEVLSHIADPYFQFVLSNISSTAPTTSKPQSIFSKLINQFVDIYQKLMPMFLKTEKAVLESSIYNALQSKLDSFINEIKVAEITEGNDNLSQQAASPMLKVGDTKVKTIVLKMEKMNLKDSAEVNAVIDAYNKKTKKGKSITKTERSRIIKLLDFDGDMQFNNLKKLNAILGARLTRSKRKKKVSTNKAEAEYISFIEYINYLRDPDNGFTALDIIAAQNKVIDDLGLNEADANTSLFNMFGKLANNKKFKAIANDSEWKIAAFEIANFERLSPSQQTVVLTALTLSSKGQKIKLKAETEAHKQQALDDKTTVLNTISSPESRREHTIYKTGMVVKKGQRIKAHLTYYVMKADATLKNRKALIDNASSIESVINEGGIAKRKQESKKGILNKWRNLTLYGTGVDTILETLSQKFGQHKKAYQSAIAYLGDLTRHGYWKGFLGTQKKLSVEITEKQVEFFGGTEKSRQAQLLENRKPRDFTFNGRTTKMTYNEAYKKWMEFQNPEVRKRFEKHNHGVEYEAALESFVPSQVLEYAAWQINDFYPALYEQINEVYKKVYGVNLVKRDFYSPIYTQTQATALDTNANVLEFQGNLDEISNSGLLELTSTDAMPSIVDGDQSLMTHVQRMSYFIGMAEPVSRFKAVFADAEVKAAIATHHNPEIVNTLKYMMDLMTKGGFMHSNGQTEKNVDSMRKTFTIGALGSNLTLIPKQLMSFAAYSADMPVGKFAASSVSTIAKLASGDKKLYEWIKNNEYIQHRWAGNIERDLADVMHSLADSKISGNTGMLNSIKAASMFPTRVGDLGAVIIGGYGFYLQEHARLIKEGKTATEAEVLATEAFAKTTDMAQQSSNINDMSTVQTAGSFGRLFTMFLSTPILYWRMAHTAMSDVALAISGKNVPQARLNDSLKRVMVFYFVLPALFTFAAQGFILDRDDDEPEEYDGFGMGATALTGAIAGVPVLGGAMQYVINKTLLEKNYQFTGSPVFSNIVKLAGLAPGYFEKLAELASEDGQDMESMLNDMTTEDIFGVAEDAAVLLQSFGYGVSTPLRTLKNFAMADEWENRGMETNGGYYFQSALGYNVEYLRQHQLKTTNKGSSSTRNRRGIARKVNRTIR